MKKLILMLLVLAGGVVNVNADVTRRFMAINQVGWTSINIYASYNDGTEKAITSAWPGTAMTRWKKVENWHDVWYVDLTIPDGVTTIKVTFNNGSSGNNNQTTDYDNLDISSQDKLFYIYDQDNNDYHGISPVELEYYISGWEEDGDHSDNNRQKLTFNTNGTYTCDLDFTSYTATGNRCVFPGFASGESNGHPWVSWDFCIRPYNTTAQIDFNNANNTLNWNGDQCWTLRKQVHYNFSFNFVSGTWSVSPYFTRDLGSAGYATFSSDYDVAIPDGVNAYYATSLEGTTKVNMTKLSNGIVSTEGAFLQGTGEKIFTPATSTDATTGNMLEPTDGNNIYDSEKNRYVFANQGGDFAFYQVKSSLSPAVGKAYLETATALAARVAFVFDDEEVSGINTVKATTAGAEGYYNLAGQRVASPTKGLYIVNGKKVIIK